MEINKTEPMKLKITSFMMTRFIVTACCVVLLVSTTRGEAVFWRVLSSNTVSITSVNRSSITWANAVPNQLEQVQRATSLVPDNWQDYMRVSSTNTHARARVADPNTPVGMVYIPAGGFEMGDAFNEGTGFFTNDVPVHTVQVSAFYMDTFEVSNEEMRSVLQWAYDEGKIGATSTSVTNNEGSPISLFQLDEFDAEISFSNGVFSVAAVREDFPCIHVVWFGEQAYCNYKSDMEDLDRCIDFSDWSCDFTKNGYRLPTEAEWEKAARGGLNGKRYPWVNTIDGSQANFTVSGDPFGAGEFAFTTQTTPVGYYNGQQTPAGMDMANGYGLYDMAGNVSEWCFDWYAEDWYSQPGATQIDTTGPANGILLALRVARGGSWAYSSNGDTLRCADRNAFSPRGNGLSEAVGFRAVRRP